jgi:hypothetical protein
MRRVACPRAASGQADTAPAEETDAGSIVRDQNGQALANVYCEDEPGRPRWREAARTHVFRSFSLNHLPP